MGKDDKFVQDVELFTEKIGRKLKKERLRGLIAVKGRLIALHSKGLVKINHSVMELLCASFLILEGYEVDVEKPLGEGLTCDIYGVKGESSLIVEVETGFVPPDHALDPAAYSLARIASKIARYSLFANKFALGVPPYHLLQFPKMFVKPPRDRKPKEITEVKTLCDIYYKHPPITFEELRNARLHTIYIIDVDGEVVREVDPDAYWDILHSWTYSLKSSFVGKKVEVLGQSGERPSNFLLNLNLEELKRLNDKK
ncbi:TPA: hypothetical protein EYP26_06035 [Candidatus Bathyarchaeota archaeon]|nr:hypothetical protein [Candidatus Bathyarchaeota archaeon]